MKFALPLAPSTNNLFFNARHGGRVPTKKYKTWRLTAGAELNVQRSELKGQGVELPIEQDGFVCLFIPFVATFDLDNRFKATLDLLVSHDILVDDNMKVVKSLQAVSNDDLKRDRMLVLVGTREQMMAESQYIHPKEGNA
jgi:Holliday junction resolvase RusA-like endonuclease